MEKHILRKELMLCIACWCLLATAIPILASITDEQAGEIHQWTLPVIDSERTISISLCVYTRTGLVKQELIVPTSQATELYQLFLRLEQEASTHPFSLRTSQLKHEFMTAIQGTTCSSPEIIKAMKTVIPPAWAGLRPGLYVSKKAPVVQSIQTTNITCFICSVGSQGVGSDLPPIMIPRPRILCLWAGFSDSATSIISFLPFGAITITGYQVGLAVGFIGIGAGFAFPTSPAYALYGYALMIRASGENVVQFP
jgi:hypothetical protein